MIITGTRVRGGKYYGGTASAVTTDTYFNLVSLLLPGNGTNGQTNSTFLDSSTNAFTVTRAGNTTQGTFSPFSQTGWSNYFDGSSDHLLVAASTGSWGDFGTGDFTIEAWIYTPAVSALQGICGAHTGGQNDTWQFRLNGSTLELFGANGQACAATTAVSANQWVFVTVSRSGANAYLGVNGSVNTVAITAGVNGLFSATSGGNVSVANLYSTPSAHWFTGYISNLRIRKGTAAYTSSFTPPTAALTAISNTQLLTCQSNRFVDNSTNAFAITVNGNTAVQAFAPFNPTTAYAAGTVGGSGYFDGTGDYLTVADNAAFEFGGGDFTIECWVYNTGTNGFIVSQQDNSTAPGSSFILFISSGALVGLVYYNGSSVASITDPTSFPLNQWVHTALVRSSNTITLYLNGTSKGTAGVSSGINNSSQTLAIGARNNGSDPLTGYISNLRIVKGTAVYTSAFTPPTAPLTAISGTSLLLSGTNGGITDAAAKNVLETVGGAAISTTQSKWGGSSMAFDSGLGSYLLLPSPQTQNFVFGSGDFTIEFFIFFTATAQFMHIYDQRPAATDGAYPTIRLSTGGNQLEYVSGGSVRIAGGSITTNVWYHVALSRSGTSTKLFLNGTQVGSTFTDTTSYLNGTNRPFIGRSGYHTVDPFYLGGYINDLRITKGYARYTANFTPPTQAFPTQ